MRNGTALFAKPAEVYSNPAVALLGFSVLVGRLHQDAGRLKVASDPAPALLINALLKSPPPGVEQAQAIFGYLSTQVSRELWPDHERSALLSYAAPCTEFSQAEIASLRAANFVPVISHAKPEHKSPSVCFFSVRLTHILCGDDFA